MSRGYVRKMERDCFRAKDMAKVVLLIEEGHTYQKAADSFPNIDASFSFYCALIFFRSKNACIIINFNEDVTKYDFHEWE